MKKIISLFSIVFAFSIIIQAQIATVGTDSWGNANGDGLVYASMAMKDSINAGTSIDTIYLSGTFTRPKMWQINAGGGIPDNSKIVYKGEGVDKTIIQAFTDEELASGTATWGDKNNLFIYLTGNIELHFVDLTIQNVFNALGSDASDHGHKAAITIGNDVDAYFKNVRFSNCNLTDVGAAVRLSSGADKFVMESCVVDSCTAGSNAVVYLNNTIDANVLSVDINNTVFKNNESLSSNGAAALYVAESNGNSIVTMDLDHCLFYKNLGYMHGQSVKIQDDVLANVYNCTFAYNEQSLEDGASVTADWFCHGATTKSNFHNTIFYGNSKAGVTKFNGIYPFGGATMSATNISMENCIVGSQRGANADALIALSVNSTISKDALTSELVLNDGLVDNELLLPLNSIAIDAGKVIVPYTDGYYGLAPDMGAFESNYIPTVISQTSTVDALGIYPNPVSDVLHMAVSDKASWSIYSLSGQSMKSGLGNVVDVSYFQSGSYIIRVNDGNEMKIEQFVK